MLKIGKPQLSPLEIKRDASKRDRRYGIEVINARKHCLISLLKSYINSALCNDRDDYRQHRARG